MNNKKGFTIVELLAVIVVLSVVISIAVPVINSSIRKSKEKAYSTKLEIISKQAKQYAQEEEDFLYESSKKYNGYVCNIVSVSDLVSAGYVDANDKDIFDGSHDVVNPKTGESMMNEKVMVYIKSKPGATGVDIYNGSIVSTTTNISQCH